MKPVIDVETGEVEWVERTPAEIEAMNRDDPPEPTVEERLAEAEAVIAALLGEDPS